MANQKILLGGVVKDEVAKLNENFEELYNKAAAVPTNNNQLENGAGYVTSTQVAQQIASATGNFATNDDVTNAINNATGNCVTSTQMNNALGGKVDKEAGKGLSTNDYTGTDKAKVANLGKIDFTTSNFSASGDYQVATLPAAGKCPAKVMKANGSNYEEVIVQTSVEGNNIVICADSAFAGYVVTV